MEKRPARWVDPVVEAYKPGIDKTLLAEQLRRSPEERMRRVEELQHALLELASAARPGLSARRAGGYAGGVRREPGLVLIIGYKFVKAGTWLTLAVVILVFMRMGLEDHLLGLAEHLRHHARAWSLMLARLVVSAASRRGLWTIVVALLADGCMSLIEGWALLHGHWWGPWLVVAATSTLLPFEVWALAHHVHPVRAVVFVANIAIVVYLARKALRERRERAHG